MAEYCLDCWNEINNTNDPPEKYILSKYPELCEGCEEIKRVIIIEREFARPLWLDILLLPFHILQYGIECMGFKIRNCKRKRKNKKNNRSPK